MYMSYLDEIKKTKKTNIKTVSYGLTEDYVPIGRGASISANDKLFENIQIKWNISINITTTKNEIQVEEAKKIKRIYSQKMLQISAFWFSSKTHKEVFLQIMADWDEEIFEALKENKDANLFMINVRNTYGFIMAMWQKSPLGDLLEYVRKIAS